MTDVLTKKSRTDTAIFAWYLAVRSRRTSRTMYYCGIQFGLMMVGTSACILGSPENFPNSLGCKRNLLFSFVLKLEWKLWMIQG